MAWKTLYNEVEFLTQYPEVALVVSDSSSPVPGYLFGEINAMTFIDHGRNCKPLVNYLISRLEVNKPLVCIKVLKLLLHLVQNGHTEMIEEVKFQEIALKEVMGFHGPPDNLHGKAFYENVRKMSKELLEFVFSENKKLNDNIPPPAPSELTGHGSTASAKKLPGFGYSVKSQKSVSEKVSDGITNLVGKLLPGDTPTDSQSIQTAHLGETLPRYKPLIINRSVPEHDDTVLEIKSSPVHIPIPMQRTKQKASVYKPGRPGGGWADSDDDEVSPTDPIIGDISKQSFESTDSLEFSKIELKEAIPDWTDEYKVVEEFTVDEDLHKLDYTVISSLCKRCSSLNCDKVLTLLMEKLSAKQENVQLKSLIFVEYLLFQDIATLESLLKIVIPQMNSLNEKDDISPVVKIKAKKICLIVQHLNKTLQQQNSKQFAETPLKFGS